MVHSPDSQKIPERHFQREASELKFMTIQDTWYHKSNRQDTEFPHLFSIFPAMTTSPYFWESTLGQTARKRGFEEENTYAVGPCVTVSLPYCTK